MKYFPLFGISMLSLPTVGIAILLYTIGEKLYGIGLWPLGAIFNIIAFVMQSVTIIGFLSGIVILVLVLIEIVKDAFNINIKLRSYLTWFLPLIMIGLLSEGVSLLTQWAGPWLNDKGLGLSLWIFVGTTWVLGIGSMIGLILWLVFLPTAVKSKRAANLKLPAEHYQAQIVKRQEVVTLKPKTYVEPINKGYHTLIGTIEPGLIWYDGLDEWENLVTGRKIAVGKDIYISPIWRNLSSIPMTGHINLMITFPDTNSLELFSAQGQDQQALPNNATIIQFQPFTSTLKGTYMLTAKLSSESKVLDTVTLILLATSEIIDNSSTQPQNKSFLPIDEWRLPSDERSN